MQDLPAQSVGSESDGPLLGGPTDIEGVLKGILAISTEAIITVGPDFRIRAFSAGAETMFGYTAKEVIGQTLDLLLPQRYRADHQNHMAGFAAQGQRSKLMRERAAIYGVRRSGEEFPIEASISQYRTDAGVIFTSIVRDITERRRHEEKIAAALAAAEAATEAKSRFLAFMSHEIRTPLNGILGMAQVMSHGRLSGVQRDRLTVLRDAGESLLVILNDILDLSKIEAGRLEFESAEFDLEGLLAASRHAFEPLAEQKGLRLVLDAAQAGGCYRGDPGRIRQIVFNLISNAVKFTSAGEVRIGASHSGGVLKIAVEDTGVGMSPDVLKSLFTPFTQADASTSRQYGGTGLGLTICRQLAELMGGTLTVVSSPAQGSLFTLRLPAERIGDRAPVAVEAALPGRVPATGLRILAAEDNPTNQVVLRALLEQIGMTLTVVGDGLAAVEAWRADPFDLILMDVQMPEMDGLQATRVIRREEAVRGLAPIPIIALTANAMPQQIEGYIETGMNAAVTKPINLTQLFETMAKTLAAPPSQRRPRARRKA